MPAELENINVHNGATPDLHMPIDTIPRLIVSSERTIESVDKLLKDAEKHKTDNEYLSSINKAHLENIPLPYYRGYTVVGNMKPIQEVAEISDDKRPIWFFYPGSLSNRLDATKDLMHLEVFRKSINRCADVLRPKGVDLLHILTTNDESIFDNILNIQVSIVSMQVAFTDLLTHLGITPNGIIGISLGEFSCAYADGCSTLEQTILATYWRGHSILNSEIIPSTSATIVGLSPEEVRIRIPSDIFVTEHLDIDKVIVRGPLESISACVNKLTSEGICAKAYNGSAYKLAFHSEYMAEPAVKLKKSLEQIFPNPKNRSSRWISTCFDGFESDAQQCSAVYHAKNFLSPVLLYEAMQHVPKNAICIEISPKGQFQKLFKRIIGPAATILTLNEPLHESNLVSCLSNIGKLYVAGAQPDVLKLHHSIG